MAKTSTAAKAPPASHERQVTVLHDECNKALKDQGRVYFADEHEVFERIPIGILAFDTITGGGIVRRKLTELFGIESSAKTLLAMHAVAAVQRKGGRALWVKGEDFDEPWAAKQGIKLSDLSVVEAVSGDAALETACSLLEQPKNPYDLLVIDSYQALGTVRELEGGIDTESYAGGGAPQMWGRVMKRLRSMFNGRRSSAAIIGISQVRDPIGKFSPAGKPQPVPTQIRSLLHGKCISVMCKRGEPRFDDENNEAKRRVLSREFHLKCVKNKTATSDRAASYTYYFRGPHPGIDKADEVTRLGKVYGLVSQKGPWIEGYGIKAQGEEAFREKLRASPLVVAELATDILAASQK